jgi:DNA-cytosine methyltransferase
MTTGATLFSGFEGAGVGMRSSGVSMRWGIEQRADAAAVAERNGFNSIVADILTVDPETMDRVDCLHASPPCTNASAAKTEGKESELDQALARKTVNFIQTLKPEIFTLENVWGYRKFVSFGIILGALEALGYWVDVAHVNSADYSVPQTRKRLILRARLGGFLPHLPNPEPWRGWYQAVEDLIPTFPASQFAEWQIKLLPDEIKTMLIANDTSGWTEAERGMNVSLPDNPSMTIKAGDRNIVKAFLCDGNNFRAMPTVYDDAPVFTMTASVHYPRAFLVDGQNARTNGEPTVRKDTEPSMSVSLSTGGHGMARAWMERGRVVKLTPRALARFQSFPDSYELPAKNALACFGIGNAVPCLVAEKIYRGMLS